MLDYQPIPEQLAKKSLILSDAVLGHPGMWQVPSREKFWNLGIRGSVANGHGRFALVMSDGEGRSRGGPIIYSRPLQDLDTAKRYLATELAILREVGYNVR